MTTFYTPAQAETDHDNHNKYTGGGCLLDQTIAQDGSRSAALVDLTLMAQIAATGYWTPLRDVNPVETAGYMTCGTFASTVKAMKLITDGSFKIGIDGETAVHVTGLNFSKVAGVGDTSGYMVTGALGCNLATLQGITTGDFVITVDGTAITITGLDFSTITTLDEAAQVIEYAAAGRFHCVYDSKSTKFMFISPTKGTISSVSALSDSGGAGADISGSGHLNGRTGTAVITAGTGYDGNGATIVDVINANATFRATGATAEWTGTAVRFVSPTLGVNSAVSVLTAGTSGTDISGAGHLNGLTSVGTAVAGTGGLDGSDTPAGIYVGGDITAAAMIAGTTTGAMLVAPPTMNVSEDDLVLENSLDLDTSIIPSRGMSIRSYLRTIGISVTERRVADANV